jgi:hypothetical protein
MASGVPLSKLWLLSFGALLGGVAILSSALAGSLAFEPALMATTSVLFAVAMVVRAAIWLWRHRPASPFGALQARLGVVVGDLALRFALFQGSIHFFIWLPPIKRAIPDGQGYWADAWLAQFERDAVGADPWAVLHRLPDWVTPATDGLYAAWIPMIVLVSMLVAVFGATALVARYFLSWALAWVVLGIGVAHLLPSAGPIFGPDLGFGFEGLRTQLQGTTALRFHDMLWMMHVTGSRDLGGGISAMPSMHCALTFIIVAAAWHSRLRVPALIYAGLIWFGSVYLGWHYVLDGAVSAIGIALIWRVAGLVCMTNAGTRPRFRRLVAARV